MAETILGIAIILGTLFIIYQIINKTARVSDLDEISNLMGDSLSMRIGDFSSRRRD